MVKYYFFLGTEAELIKTFPIIKVMEARHIPYYIIASGQNDISKSRVLKYTNGGRIDLELSYEKDIVKSAKGLLKWFFKTYRTSHHLILERFPELCRSSKDTVMIVHGDTISTVMGAYIGRKFGMRVAHIEAGLRSHHLFSPFPEEIDRILVDRISDYLFVPGQQSEGNANRNIEVKVSGITVSDFIVDMLERKDSKKTLYNTIENSLRDSLAFSKNLGCENEIIKRCLGKQYFVFVLHRQENIQNDRLINMLVDQLFEAIKTHYCVVVLHKITEIKLQKMGLLDRIKEDNHFVLLPRAEYFDFMKLLSSADYVITDGGSNQEELSYMGVPALVIRKSTERTEGLGKNIMLYEGDESRVRYFFKNYAMYKIKVENDVNE